MNRRALLMASGISGVVMALLTNLPVIEWGNCIGCLWLWGSGILGVWLYQNNAGGTTGGEGAAIGALSGLVGAVVGTILGTILGGSSLATILTSLLGDSNDGILGSFAIAGAWSFMGLLVNIFIYPLFGAIGGAVGGTIFKKPASNASQAA